MLYTQLTFDDAPVGGHQCVPEIEIPIERKKILQPFYQKKGERGGGGGGREREREREDYLPSELSPQVAMKLEEPRKRKSLRYFMQVCRIW